MKMNKKLLIAATLVSAAALSHASGMQADAVSRLHQASQNIEKHTDPAKISESLYKQLRPRANITNPKLSKAQVDEKVRKYISDKYAPALIGNYAQLYAKMRANHKDFSDCNDPVPMKAGEDVLVSLCLASTIDAIEVRYLTNAYSRGWNQSAGFVFSMVGDKLQLVGIELPLKPGTKAYVEGI